MSRAPSLPALLSNARPAPLRPTHPFTASRYFHDYFTTHLPSSSLHPDSRLPSIGPNHHKLPRASSVPHVPGPSGGGRTPSALPASGTSRDTTVVRIPLRSAKHHFGASSVRGSRPYNEDTWQAGTIEVPAFAQRQPISLSRRARAAAVAGKAEGQAQTQAQAQEQPEGGNRQGQSASGDPQVFYFGVFDGHGGEECSAFLRDRLHGYLEDGAEKFGLKSSLVGEQEVDGEERVDKAKELQQWLVREWSSTVGGYFRRFKPEFFTALLQGDEPPVDPAGLNAMLSFAFLNADLQFTQAQAHKTTGVNKADDPVLDDKPINEHDLLSHPLKPASQNLTTLLQAPIGGSTRFQGGSTCSVALISTPTPMPFWNPASPSTLVAAHVGDTRILLCRVSDGIAVPLTSNHHPSTPVEAARLRRFAASFVTDSFGEERILGLANTRAFGDVASKRMGVSAEPQITTTELGAGEYSFLVLMSDGVSAVLDDQEVADIVKEARTPDEACRSVVNFATEVSEEADNATCLVVRLGGWERRGEGGEGSLGTREKRDFRRREAENPRSRRN